MSDEPKVSKIEFGPERGPDKFESFAIYSLSDKTVVESLDSLGVRHKVAALEERLSKIESQIVAINDALCDAGGSLCTIGELLTKGGVDEKVQ